MKKKNSKRLKNLQGIGIKIKIIHNHHRFSKIKIEMMVNHWDRDKLNNWNRTITRISKDITKSNLFKISKNSQKGIIIKKIKIRMME